MRTREGSVERIRDLVNWPPLPRTPAVVLLAATVAGIVIDRHLPLSASVWGGLAAGSLALCLWNASRSAPRCIAKFCPRRFRASSVNRCISYFARRGWGGVLTTLCLAAAWHHECWYTVAADNVVHVVRSDDPFTPIVVSGRAVSAITTFRSGLNDGGIPHVTQKTSRFRMRIDWMRRSGRWVSASGMVWIHLSGETPALSPGDEVTLCGNLTAYRPPLNPGQRDVRALHRAQREYAFVQTPLHNCIHVVHVPSTSWRWWLPRLRQTWLAILRRELSESTAALAGALLLGRRDGFDTETRDGFLRTGTVHLLSISGLHVGILAAPWLFAARARLLPFRVALLGVVVITAAYAALADSRAPVVRASILVQVLCLSWITRRRLSWANSLGIAGMVVLMRNPSDLFRPGTLLSFLAVAVLGRYAQHSSHRRPKDPLDRLIWRTRPKWWRILRRYATDVSRLFVASVLVWLVTAPLVIQSFHVISPMTVLLNLVLLPALAVGLQAGFALLLVADLWPHLGSLIARVCETSLQLILTIVRGVDAWPGSHVWMTGPGKWAVAACYVCIFCGWGLHRHRKGKWVCYGLACCCLLAGWSHGSWYRHQMKNRLRCTILSVGHGTCAVLQLPDGQVWLYDAGRRGSVRDGVDRVARYLWSERIGRVDAVILSHADVDHYSLVPGLADRFGIQEVFTGPRPLRPENPGEAWLIQHLRRLHLEPKPVVAGHRWRLGDGGSMTVLHPDGEVEYENDNASSIVLLVRHPDGGTILLPGDLESSGIESLARRRLRVDVAMAPHHGSLRSDPPRFLRWCRPTWCVISGSDAGVRSIWERVGRATNTRILHTSVEGAVEVDLGASRVDIRAFRSTHND